MKMGSVIVEQGKKVLTMTEYIERESLSEEIRKYYYKNPPNFSYGEGFDRGLDRAQRAILDAPTADVAEVVRCKDFKYFGLNDENVPYCINPFGLDDPEPNGFCNYGRK